MADDGWELDKGGYSPNEFYIRSTDKKGHGTTLHVKFPDYLVGGIGELVASKEHPYRTTADFIRDAVVHRLRFMADIHPEMLRLTSMVHNEIRMARTEQYMRDMEELDRYVKNFQEACALARQVGDWDMLAGLVIEGREAAHMMRDPYGERVGNIAKEYFTQLDGEWRDRITRGDNVDDVQLSIMIPHGE